MNQINILHISPNFNYTCGVSKYLTIVLKELKKHPEINLFFITNGGDSLIRLKKIGVEPVLLKFESGLKNFFYLKSNLRYLKKFCIENKIDIIHTHHRYPEFLANQLKQELNIKTITTVHSLVRSFRSLSFKSNIIIAVSKAVESNLINYFGVDTERIIQIYNPVEFNYFNITDEDNLNHLSNYRVILFIGRNNKVKGLDLLLKAFNNISRIYSDIALVIVSDLTEKQKQKITEKNERIFIFLPQQNVYQFYRKADIVILPSYLESFPYVMLESGFYKKLFIGSNVDGIKEFIEDGIDGLIFKRGDGVSLINTLKYALELNSEAKNFLINNLHKKVTTLDTPVSYIQKLKKIYTELL